MEKTVNNLALKTWFEPLIGKQVTVKKQGKKKSEVLVFGLPTSIPNIYLAVKQGSFHSKGYMNAGYSVNVCQGGYLRAWDNEDSIMLVLRRL